jgi:tetratricopeptide (TPR) repeat protein
MSVATTGANNVAMMAPPQDGSAAALLSRAYALSTEGRFGAAFAIVEGELERQPADREALFARATILFDWGRIREARDAFLKAEAAGLERTALYLNLAWTCHMLRSSDEAERYARKAIASDHLAVAAHFGLGTILQRLKRYPEALASYEGALAVEPEHSLATAGIAHCKLEQKDYAGAEEWMRRAVELAPANPQFRTNLGVAMANQERYGEALDSFKQAEALESTAGMPHESVVDSGFTLISMGRNDEAAALYRRYLPEVPDPRAHSHYAFLLLTHGQFHEGWDQYEFRWMQEPHLSHRPGYRVPRWAGQDLAGKTILLMPEQGAGDIIHFARFAVPLKAMGATVLMEVRPEFAQLARDFAGVDQVLVPPTPAPPFDYYIHLMSIPHVLKIELANIPSAVPYIGVNADKARHWAGEISGSGLKVGLAWAGNPAFPRDRFRSIPLGKLDGLLRSPGVRFFSLQKPLKPGELEQFPTEPPMVDLAPNLADFTDTAAAISQLDLVICVDTAIAHLAGALGKPVWLLLPEIGDFRWMQDREDCPWYPTMRLFRQRHLGEWDEVIARVQEALQGAVRGSVEALEPGGETLAADVKIANISDIARVTETRHGLMQYLPDGGMAARSIAWYGEHLEPQLDLMAQFVRPGAHVVEAGSGVGVHSLALAGMVGAAGHLLLYETRPARARILRQNLDINRLSGNVTFMRRQLAGPQEASRDLASSAEALDELLLERLDLVKIGSDTVAAEILDGAGATLWRLRPVLFIAAVDSVAAGVLAARAKEFGYRCWRMETPYFNPGNFNGRDNDIFDGAIAIALLAIPEEVDVAVTPAGCVELTDDIATRESAAKSENGKPGWFGRLRGLLR